MKKKNPSTDTSCELHGRKSVIRPKRIILDCTKQLGFENSHGSFWFRGPLLGKGSVFLARMIHSNLFHDSLIAVKSSFFKHSSSLRFEKRVFDDLNSCSNIVQCYGDEITTTTWGKQVYNLLLEYCSGGSLQDRIAKFKPNGGGGLPELEVRRYTKDIVCGIASIHEHGYIHCDIKPENILLKPSVDYGVCLVAKVADFGLAMKRTNVVTIDDDNIRGTKPYMAPELLRDCYIDWPVDIWALGC